MNLLYILISGLMFRIRGGLKIKGHKLPLCKWWFAVWFACLSCILRGWGLNTFLVVLIATRLATQLCGWGEVKGCACGIGKPNPDRKDFPEVDEFIDNFEYKGWRLIDHPILFGVVGLTFRGVYLSFIIGLALNSIPFMLCGAFWGLECYLCGLFARKVLKKMDKTGWNADEYCVGGWLALNLILWG